MVASGIDTAIAGKRRCLRQERNSGRKSLATTWGGMPALPRSSGR